MMCLVILLVLLTFCLDSINGDCGLPAIPVHAKIYDMKEYYFEDETIEYYCELLDQKLVGGKTRKCKSSRWTGPIPQCGMDVCFANSL